MPIAALPKETARAITSTLALNDAASVVKELVDNALDSRADTINVELSANTLDIIQVKDNGSGVGVEDRQLLCKRGCTSKIRSIDDLAALGGSSLGFRGEALASAAELSTSVTITTRVEGELVGTALKFGPDGKLLHSSSASHPVGTTVRILGFLSKIPVRRRTGLKNTTSTIASTRNLLASYAFARSEVRYSLKLLKAQNEKSNWSFIPNKHPGELHEAATKILGNERADQCLQHTTELTQDDSSDLCWRIEAVLLSPKSDGQKACHSNQFFSVDKRPLTSERTVMKGLSKLYQQYLRYGVQDETRSLSFTKPFLCVRIFCPSDTYDINIEPAKNEVLFYQPHILTDLFKKLMREVYGDIEPTSNKESTPKPLKKTTSTSFDMLLARRPQPETSTAVIARGLDEGDVPSDGNAIVPSTPLSVADVGGQAPNTDNGNEATFIQSDVENNEVESQNEGDANEHSTGDEEITDSANIRNPWSLAKLNIRIPPKKLVASQESDSEVENAVPDADQYTELARRTSLLLPQEQMPFQNPGPPMRRRMPRVHQSDNDSITTSSSESNENHRGNTMVDNWVTRAADMPTHQQIRFDSGLSQPDYTLLHDSEPVSSQHSLPIPHTSSPGRASADNMSHRQRFSRPFKSPFKRAPVLNHLDQQSSPGPHQGIQTPPSSSRGELDEILDFERRKRIAIAQQRKRLAAKGNQTLGFSLPSPSSQSPRVEIEGASTDNLAFSRQSAIPASLITDGSGLTDLSSRFGSESTQPREPKSNPHLNRYLAATRNLSAPQSHSDRENTAHTHAHPESVRHSTQTVASSVGPVYTDRLSEIPKIPDTDPRGYMIKFREHQSSQNHANLNSLGLTTTGLKVRRAKTSKLPLEVVPIGHQIHDLAVDFDVARWQTREVLTRQVDVLGRTDQYVKTGTNESIIWNTSTKDVEGWEGRIKILIMKMYRPDASRNGGTGTRNGEKRQTSDDHDDMTGNHNSPDEGLTILESYRSEPFDFDIDLQTILREFTSI